MAAEKTTSDTCLLVGDIGGTNARFALSSVSGVEFEMQKSIACADFATAGEAIGEYLRQSNLRTPDAVCLAVAGPIVDNSVRFTNNHWEISGSDLSAEFGGASVQLLNDFEAIAYSLPFLAESDIHAIGLPEDSLDATSDFTIVVIGPGTGLGCAGLMHRDGVLVPVRGEGGHSGFAPESQVQVDVLGILREQFDRVSNERLLSGPGIENIYRALCKLHGERPKRLTAADIFQRGESVKDSRAEEAVQLFFELLGQVAGDLALTIKAIDGVYIAGGIVQRYPQIIENSRFRPAFESKGRYRSFMEQIPTRLITHRDPGLLGASYFVGRLVDA